MRRYSTSFDKENDFVLIYHILAEFRKEFKSKIRLKTASTEKEATYGEMESQEEQIQSLLKNHFKSMSILPWSRNKYGNLS